MNKTLLRSSAMTSDTRARSAGLRDWQRWAPYAAVLWSLVYATLSAYWAVSRHGFPYTAETMSDGLGPLLARFGPGIGWIVVMTAGIPAVALGTAMLRGVRGKVLRPLFITAGALLAGVLLLFMTGLNLLVMVGYIPYAVLVQFPAEKAQTYLGAWTEWATIHQLLCLLGGFLWLGATISYARRSGDACLYCGRRDRTEGWTNPNQAARWGRIAVYVAMVVPILYALTRYAWVVGIPWGMSEEHFRSQQANGTFISGLFLANFGLVGALLMLGLVQHWGEEFPRWMIGLAGRRVPIALAVVPASIVSVLLMVGGLTIGSGFAQMADSAAAIGENIWIVVGPTLLFPVWSISLVVATLGYYYRRRGPCNMCGRGTSMQNFE